MKELKFRKMYKQEVFEFENITSFSLKIELEKLIKKNYNIDNVISFKSNFVPKIVVKENCLSVLVVATKKEEIINS